MKTGGPNGQPYGILYFLLCNKRKQHNKRLHTRFHTKNKDNLKQDTTFEHSPIKSNNERDEVVNAVSNFKDIIIISCLKLNK